MHIIEYPSKDPYEYINLASLKKDEEAKKICFFLLKYVF